jgi:hypothetical protein
VEAIVAAAQAGSDGFPAGSANRVLAARDYLAVAPAAVRVRTDVEIEVLDDLLPSEPADLEALTALVEELGIASSVQRVEAAIALAAAARTS